MTTLEAIVLGIIQGLTEFLPVSSSGHLVLFQQLFGLKEAELFFDVCVHVGTLLAVVGVFRQEIINIIAAMMRLFSKTGPRQTIGQRLESDADLKMALLIAIGTIPTAILGLLFRGIADRLFASAFIAGMMLIITGSLLWLTRWATTDVARCRATPLTPGRAFAVGIVQGLAIVPGISRSGSTISFGILIGVRREMAARYSFLLSIPAIIGAGLLSLEEGLSRSESTIYIALIGAATAAVVGYGALKSLLHVVKNGRLHWFAPYCWLAGILAIIFSR